MLFAEFSLLQLWIVYLKFLNWLIAILGKFGHYFGPRYDECFERTRNQIVLWTYLIMNNVCADLKVETHWMQDE